MRDNEYGLISFATTHHALKAEKLLKEENYSVEMRPIPPSISADCGFGIEFEIDKIKGIKEFLGEKTVQTEGYYHIIKSGNKKSIKKI
ncbi:MAG: DUF3343 domain-containing protein [Halarsenatibacteraceae bacterium]